MESSLARQLADLLKQTEDREVSVGLREQAAGSREAALTQRLEALEIREAAVREESAKLEIFRNIADERRRNEDMTRKNAQDAEKILSDREAWSAEEGRLKEQIRRDQEECVLWKERIAKSEKETEKEREDLRNDKIAHRDRVIKELMEIEQKKLGAKHG